MVTDASQNFGRPRGDSSASMYSSQGPGAAGPKQRPQLGGKQLGGKQLPPPPSFAKEEKAGKGKGKAGAASKQSQAQPQSQASTTRPAPQSPPNPRPPLQNPTLPTIRLSPNRAPAQIPANTSSSPQPGDMQRQPSTGRKRLVSWSSSAHCYSALTPSSKDPPAWLNVQLAKLKQER